MRTKHTTQAPGSQIKGIGYLEFHQVPPELQTLLAWVNLDSVTLNFPTQQETYTHWEYECECCGSYEHSTQRCPELQKPEDSWAYDDH